MLVMRYESLLDSVVTRVRSVLESTQTSFLAQWPHTLAVSNTLLNRHILLVQAGPENESVGVAILETARVNKRLERLNAGR